MCNGEQQQQHNPIPPHLPPTHSHPHPPLSPSPPALLPPLSSSPSPHSDDITGVGWVREVGRFQAVMGRLAATPELPMRVHRVEGGKATRAATQVRCLGMGYAIGDMDNGMCWLQSGRVGMADTFPTLTSIPTPTAISSSLPPPHSPPQLHPPRKHPLLLPHSNSNANRDASTPLPRAVHGLPVTVRVDAGSAMPSDGEERR